MTAYAGLPVYLDLAHVLGLADIISNNINVKTQGWTDEQIIMSLILLNLTGGDCVEDMNILEKDEGFCRVLQRVELKTLSRQQRRTQVRRWKKEKHRTVPSPSVIFRYLSVFHNTEQEKFRVEGKAFIPLPNEQLLSLVNINKDFAASVQKHSPCSEATIDQDATLAATQKKNALFSYKGYSAYQPFNTWWAEQQMILHTEFRDGNVPAGYEQLRVFKESLDMLPPGVTKVYLRSDTAGYQHDLLKYCENRTNERFGKIEFAIGCDVTKEFKKAVAEVEEWKPLTKEIDGKIIATGKEWAEVCFVPNAIGHSKNSPAYRYLATRELLRQGELPGIEQEALPFPTMSFEQKRYKIYGIVTNRTIDGNELIHWYHKRCGKSEEAHSVMKEDLAGGQFPSGCFGANAAWWWIMVLAFNLNTAMKRLVLKGSWVKRKMKAIRFSIITLPGRIIERSRELFIRLTAGHPSLELLINARQRIMELTSG